MKSSKTRSDGKIRKARKIGKIFPFLFQILKISPVKINMLKINPVKRSIKNALNIPASLNVKFKFSSFQKYKMKRAHEIPSKKELPSTGSGNQIKMGEDERYN
jgi:hypothetical protein